MFFQELNEEDQISEVIVANDTSSVKTKIVILVKQVDSMIWIGLF